MDFPGRDATNDLKIRISQAMKIHYWLGLSKSFHARIFSHSWATKTSVCKQATSHFRRLHKLWAAKKHRHAQSLERKRQLKLKTLAEMLFKGTKKSYEVSENEKFAENRLPAEQSRLLKVTFVPFNVSSNEKIQYITPVTKFDRHGYKRRKRILVVTDKNLYVVADEGKTLKLKQKLPLNCIEKLEVTSERDNFLLIRVPLHLKNQKGDLVLEVPFLVEMITWIIKMIKRPEILNINAPNSQPICHNRVGEKQGLISITRGLNVTPGIMKGKQGNLIIVG